MMSENMPIFQDLTAWFSDSVSTERKTKWKEQGGKQADYDSAQFIFSENADSKDTKQIFQSSAYRDEHLAVFHAKYISDSTKVPTQKIPVGKYFLPPKEIQNLVRKQMKYIWDDTDSGVSSEEDDEKTVGVHIGEDTQHTGLKSNKDNDRKKSDGQRLDGKTDPKATPSKKRQNASLLANSPKENSKRQNDSQLHKPKSNTSSDKRKSNEDVQNYSFRKRTPKNYSDLPYIDVGDIVLDNTDKGTMDSHVNTNGHSSQTKSQHNQDFFCIDDLPKVTSEMEDLIPGQNGFEVVAKS
ncbi:telomere repeats-binding bouquet formation protein 2-like [Mytilus californianus]|uniref:telomere repeats-binding bouquet formation protein 2-like n=1 Tax=Mytilus californianus TaxID=6549 RepID=UPI0022453A33|nr:telomere repeats-binding bouquet formation protein 2-like [Mytilus californianus]XP_052102385.1 telomere repeats-binding bouquet formation protein 2-like [Mytilus californianus]